jgi:hypothetical protein
MSVSEASSQRPERVLSLQASRTNDSEVFVETVPDEDAAEVDQQSQFLVSDLERNERVPRVLWVEVASCEGRGEVPSGHKAAAYRGQSITDLEYRRTRSGSRRWARRYGYDHRWPGCQSLHLHRVRPTLVRGPGARVGAPSWSRPNGIRPPPAEARQTRRRWQRACLFSAARPV